jgi:hypothetical protein
VKGRWFELCAGSLAVGLRLVGGPYLNPPIAFDGEHIGRGRTFSAQSTEWLTMNRPPAWKPSVQIGMFQEVQDAQP